MDVLNNPLRFTGSASGGLEIVIAGGGGQLTGTVTDVRSQPIPSTRIVLVPDRTRSRPDLYRTATTDPNGRFSLAAVAPGDYRIFAWESMEEFGWFDPDTISRSENKGRAVHVTETSSEAVDVKLIPADGAR
jgi:protocatechuate 3,4-dioxygenase beta subunit